MSAIRSVMRNRNFPYCMQTSNTFCLCGSVLRKQQKEKEKV